MLTIEWTDREVELRAEAGERLLDVADERPQTGTLFACRSGHCGSCRVRVVAGHDLLEKPRTEEQETLRAIGARSDERLACQVTVAHGVAEGRVCLARIIATPADPTQR